MGMWQRLLPLVLVGLLTSGCLPPVPTRSARLSDDAAALVRMQQHAQARAAWGRLPLSFVENRGQTDTRVAYHTNLGGGATAFFTPGGLTVALRGEHAVAGADEPVPGTWALRLAPIGADPAARPVGVERAEGIVSYLVGPTERHAVGVPAYYGVAYPEVWPGIDLVYGQQDRRLKYSFVLQPGADPRRIQVEIGGATDARVLEDGALEVATPLGGYRDTGLVAYQDVDGRRVTIPAAFELTADPESGTYRYGFSLGTYDPSLPLVIDPVVMIYGTYLGGSSSDAVKAIAVDGSGNAYVAGDTGSTQATFPDGDGFGAVPGLDQTYNGNNDIFVAKLNAAGTGLVYATYLGGSGTGGLTGIDAAQAIAVDGAGSAYIAGWTRSTQATFPDGDGFGTVPGFNQTYNASDDAFVVKLNAAGTGLVYATYLGGSELERAYAIAVDGSGSAYVAGETNSTQVTFPGGSGFGTIPGFDQTYNGDFRDAFVVKLDAAGTGLVYATYLGGSGTGGLTGIDAAYGIAVDGSGNVYVAGNTSSTQTTFPDGDGFGTVPGFDQTHNGGDFDAFVFDAFVAKLNAAGTDLVYATYLGGVNFDAAQAIAVDGSGSAYVAGRAESTQATFPDGDGFGAVPGFDQTHNGGSGDAFAAKLNAAGTGLVYATYLGGGGGDYANAIAVNGSGSTYVAGRTDSTQASFPDGDGFGAVPGFDQTHNGGDFDAFVVKLSAAGTDLESATYLGGSSGDTFEAANTIAVDAAGGVYVAGVTASTQATFPDGDGFGAVPGFDQTHNGGDDGFVVKFSDAPAGADVQLVSKVDSPDPATVGQQLNYSLTVKNNGPADATGVTLTDTLPGGVSFASASAGCLHASGTVTCTIGSLANGAQTTVTIVVTPNTPGSIVNNASVSATTTDPTPGNNAAQASTVVQATPEPCAQRPRVLVQSQVVSVGGVPRLRATISSQTSGPVPVNSITSVQFTQIDAARISILPSGPSNQTAPFTHTPSAGTTQVQFDLARTTAGSGVPAMARLIVNDTCGPWQTFVGAGSAVGI